VSDYLAGWAVFPVVPGTKKPYAGSHGVLDATDDPDQVARWRAGLGCSFGGSCAGRLVLDLDAYRHPEALEWWRENRHRLPPTRKHGRGRRSRHLVYLTSEPGPWRRQLAPGTEVKAGPGQFVMLPPSLHPSGERYEVLDWRQPAAAPTWLTELSRKPPVNADGPAGAPAPEPIRALTSREWRAITKPYSASDSDHSYYVAIIAFAEGRSPGQVISVLERDPPTVARWDDPARPGLRERELPSLLAAAMAAARPSH
jgi:Bifunctional DNA primase/polymerase, N-terminal